MSHSLAEGQGSIAKEVNRKKGVQLQTIKALHIKMQKMKNAENEK